jgi:hypothetical protein
MLHEFHKLAIRRARNGLFGHRAIVEESWLQRWTEAMVQLGSGHSHLHLPAW